jgi:dephospho-CoA kinase
MIIGITGTLGAGKGSVVAILKEKGFSHFSASGFISEEIKKRGLPVNRDTMTEVGEDLRAVFGASYVVDSLAERAKEGGGNVIIESIRAVGEVDALKKKGGILLGVTADATIRYARITERKSEKDNVTFEKFLADEDRESHGTDPAKMNLPAVISLADYTIDNNGSLHELAREVNSFLEKFI